MQLATAARVAVVLVANNEPGRPLGLNVGTLEPAVTVLSVSQAVGALLSLAAVKQPPAIAYSAAGLTSQIVLTNSMCADSSWGDPNSIIMVGAHLDRCVVAGFFLLALSAAFVASSPRPA